MVATLDNNTESISVDISEMRAQMESKDLSESKLRWKPEISWLANVVRDDKHRRILQWLCPVDPRDRFEAMHQMHTYGTSEWLLNHQLFARWSSLDRSLLWVTGARKYHNVQA